MNKGMPEFNNRFLKQVAIRANEMLIFEPDGSNEELSKIYFFSEEYSIWKNKTIKEANQPKRSTQNIKRILLIAAIIIALIVGAMSVNAIREYIYEMILIFKSDHAEISYSATSNSDYTIENQANSISTIYTPAYIPESYELIYEEKTPLCYHSIYTSKTGLIEYQQYTINNISLVDTERHETQTVDFNNATATYFYSDSLTCFIWAEYGYNFCITSDLPLDEIMRIAYSIGE